MPDHEVIETAIDIIDDKAKSLGLDFYETEFEIVNEDLMAQIHAYILPVRFQHWSFGKEYQRIKTKAKYGYGGFAYETVINSDPAYSFLLENNSLTEMKTVIAHVLGHVDFMKNNGVFLDSNRRQVTDCAVNAARVAEYAQQYGEEVVERWLDACLAMVPQIDFSARTRRRGRHWWMDSGSQTSIVDEVPQDIVLQDEFDFLFEDEKLRRLAEDEDLRRRPHPIMERDLLYFLMHSRFSDLEPWQRDVMSIVHEEWMYFQPNIRTKVMNEGWATYWHQRIMEELDVERDFFRKDGDDDFLRYNRMNAGVLSRGRPGHINPYLLGLHIWRRIFDRWEDPSPEDSRALSLAGGEGARKMIDARNSMTDTDFVRNYLDKQIIEDLDLFCFQRTGMDWTIVETDWRRVRDALATQLMVRGTPIIYVVDDDYMDRRELLLFHEYDGEQLAEEDTRVSLGYLAQMWKRSVHLVTVSNLTHEVGLVEGKPGVKRVIGGEPMQVVYSNDGVRGQVAVYVGTPQMSPSHFAADHFGSKWHTKRVMDAVRRQRAPS